MTALLNETKVPMTAVASNDSVTLERIVDAYKPLDVPSRQWAQESFRSFLDHVVRPEHVISDDLERNVKYWIHLIDQKLTAQVNEVLHNSEVQKLEGTWRGLHYLVQQTETSPSLQIKVLNVGKRELFKDLSNRMSFDESSLFKKVYETEYGTLGGHPFGMLVGDYDFSHRAEDVLMLEKIAGVAAAAHAPFVAAAAPETFGMERFNELSGPQDLARIFETVEYTSWRSFRESEDSRYVALTMPRVLGRLPYGQNFTRVEEFAFEEAVDGADHDRYLWMNAAWAYASRVTDAMAKYGWMARTCGVEAGGRVEGLPVHTFSTDEGDVAMKCPTEIAITDRREGELSRLGFLPLLHCKNRDFAAFLGAQSCQKAKRYLKASANENADLSTRLNYMMCVSRFAHYLKVMVRDKIGQFMEVEECERWLNEWIMHYTVANPESLGDDIKARHPLREARVEVRKVPGKPGWYEATAWLRPHFQLQGLDVSLRLVSQVPPRKG